MKPQVTSWLIPGRVFDGGMLRAGQAIGHCGGQVVAVVAEQDVPAGARRETCGGIVAPGYLDLQVNGGGGVLFNQTPTTEGLAAIAAAHRALGTAGILATVITDAPGVMAAAAEAVTRAFGAQGLLGIHLEGPHIAEARRGTHSVAHIRPLDEATISLVAGLRAHGIPVMITLAPEAVQPGQIARLAETGAVVSLGHSDATAEQARAALAEGARCVTHLFNAMSPMLNRAPGMVGAAINSTAHAGIICDGIHVADEMVGLAIRARPVPERMFLVSDAMPTVGGPDSFELYGRTIRLREGKLVNEEGSLAGAHVTMAESAARLVATVGVDPQTALAMGVSVPAGLIGRADLAGLAGRRLDDLNLLEDDLSLRGNLGALMSTPAVQGR